MCGVGFVAADLLRRDHPVEVGVEPLRGGGEEVVVDVGDDAELEARAEAVEGVDGVREGGPVTDRGREGFALGRRGVEAEWGPMRSSVSARTWR